MNEISAKHRADVILFLCHQKVTTEEFSKFMKRLIDETYDQSKEQQWYDTDPVLLGEGIVIDNSKDVLNKVKRQFLVFMEDGKLNDCRIYSSGDNTKIIERSVDFKLETNSPDDLDELIAKLDEANNTNLNNDQNEDEESKTRRKTRQATKPKVPSETESFDNNVLIEKLQELKPRFIEINDAWNKRQTIYARKIQTLQRSRALITRQRTRTAEKEHDYALMLRSRTRNHKNNEIDDNEDQSDSPRQQSDTKPKNKFEVQETRRKERQDTERKAREDRLQKREMMKEYNRLRAQRKRQKKARRTKGAKYSARPRKGSVYTEDESDLFETMSYIEQDDEIDQEEVVAGEDELDESSGLKIFMEANVYRLLGKYEQGLQEMTIDFNENTKSYVTGDVQEFKDRIWIKGEWVMPGDNLRSKMEYHKVRDYALDAEDTIFKAVEYKMSYPALNTANKIVLESKESKGDSKKNPMDTENSPSKESLKEENNPADDAVAPGVEKIPNDQEASANVKQEDKIDPSKQKTEEINKNDNDSTKHEKLFLVYKDFSRKSMNFSNESEYVFLVHSSKIN